MVKNTYIASQEFNGKVAEAKALAATGVVGALTIEDTEVSYRISHAQDGAVEADDVTLRFKRPVGEDQDFELALRHEGEGVFVARHAVAGGTWIVDRAVTPHLALKTQTHARLDELGEGFGDVGRIQVGGDGCQIQGMGDGRIHAPAGCVLVELGIKL